MERGIPGESTLQTPQRVTMTAERRSSKRSFPQTGHFSADVSEDPARSLISPIKRRHKLKSWFMSAK